MRRNRDASDEPEDAHQLQLQERRVRNTQANALFRRTNSVGEEPGGHDVEQRVATDHDKRALDQRLPSGLEYLRQWGSGLLVVLLHLLEHRSLLNLQANPQADDDHHDGQQERNAPAPAHERALEVASGVAQHGDQDEEQAVGQQEAERCAELGPHARPRAAALSCCFCGQQGRAGPLAAQAKALAEAHQCQQRRRPDTGLGIGGQQADNKGGDAHRQQCADQGRLTPNLVAEVAEQY